MNVEGMRLRTSGTFILGCCHSFASAEGSGTSQVKLSQISASSLKENF